MTRDPWNRCDVCGRFISYADFASGKARCILATPESNFTSERYETTCAEHTKKPFDPGVNQYNGVDPAYSIPVEQICMRTTCGSCKTSGPTCPLDNTN